MSEGKVVKEWPTVRVEKESGITWVILNRPEKRNAMNPRMHFDMVEVLEELEADDETDVLVLTGAGESFCAGQDLKEYFRELDDKPKERRRVNWATHEWRYRRLSQFPKPTIACVNGWCFGGAFTQVIACDLAIAAEEAVFGLSEVNWGILPGGLVTKMVADALSYRDAMYYIITGDTFTGREAAGMKLVNRAVPQARLREETVALARKLQQKNPHAIRAAKEAYRACRWMDVEAARDYLAAKSAELRASDPERGRDKGIAQFIDEKRYRPGLEPYPRA